MSRSRGGRGPPPGNRNSEPCWLAIGRGSAEALREHWARRAGVTDDLEAPILQVADVHDALDALHRAAVTACVVSAGVLETRPEAALRVLRAQLGAAPLVVLDGAQAVEARDAARSLGVPLWGAEPIGLEEPGAARTASPQGASSTAAARVAITPAAATTWSATELPAESPEEAAAEAPAAPTASPLPRADANAPQAVLADPGRFSDGCLERIGRLGSLIDFVLRTLGEVSSANRISLMLSEADRRMLRLRAGRGVHESLLGAVRCPVGTGIAGRVAALGRPASGHGSAGGPRGYDGSAYVVLPLGTGRQCEGVASLTGLPSDALPSDEILRSWTALCRRAGLALRGARRLQRARALSTRDALTGLPNRRAFESALKRELERARRAGSALVVGLVDVDHFKSFNDRYGHAVGDRVLIEVARRLQAAFRETDLVARWGGEEFAVLLPCPNAEEAGEAEGVLDRARRAVGGCPFALGDGFSPATVTVSGGCATFPKITSSPEDLVEAADKALYEAKDQGRDRIVSN